MNKVKLWVLDKFLYESGDNDVFVIFDDKNRLVELNYEDKDGASHKFIALADPYARPEVQDTVLEDNLCLHDPIKHLYDLTGIDDPEGYVFFNKINKKLYIKYDYNGTELVLSKK